MMVLMDLEDFVQNIVDLFLLENKQNVMFVILIIKQKENELLMEHGNVKDAI